MATPAVFPSPSASNKRRPFSKSPSKRLLKFIPALVVLTLLPPIFFHFRLKHFHQMRLKKCGWLENPPLVCSRRRFQQGRSQHCKDLQRMSGNDTMKAGYMSKKEVVRTNCKNCLIWAKSDMLGRDVIKLTRDVPVGYIIMKDPSTGTTSKLRRMTGAGVAGVYHPLIDERLVRILRGKGKKIYAWTVDDADSLHKLLLEHVDAIITGHPSRLHRMMADMKTECLEDGIPLP